MENPIQHDQPTAKLSFSKHLHTTYLTNTPGFIDRSRPLGATTAAVAKSCNADTYTSANPKCIFAFIQAILRYRVVSVASALCGLSSKPGLTSADKLVTMGYN